MELKQQILDILNQAQAGLHHHRKLLKTLQELAEKTSDTNHFFETFFAIFSNALIVFKREPAVERLVEFVAKYSMSCLPRKSSHLNGEGSSTSESDSDQEEENFTSCLVTKLLSVHEAKEKAVRFRVCQLLSKLISIIADDGTVHLNSSLLDLITDAMLIRLCDKVPVIRIHAILTLAYLQDPQQEDCPIISSLLWSLENDSSPDVRKTVVMNIAITHQTLPVLIGRARDISAPVRRVTFLILSQKCSIKHLQIKQRLMLLQCGLKDRNELVKNACVCGLLRKWCHELEGDFFNLLLRLDVESSPDIAELMLISLFNQIDEETLLESMEKQWTSTHKSEQSVDCEGEHELKKDEAIKVC